MKASWLVEFRTGTDLSDNDRTRICERIEEALAGLADEYMARLLVQEGHFVPGPLFR